MKVVIVGGGFGGVKTALELASHKGMQVTLISDRDHFLYYPALYDTASGGSRKESIVPMEAITYGKNIDFVVDEIVSIDADRKTLIGAKDRYQYDNAVLAMGVVTNYFGIKGLHEYSYSIKSEAEVQRFREHLHQQATIEHHMDKNYIVVGGGATGVELSASIRHYLDMISRNHKAGRTRFKITLVEAAPRILPRMSEATSRAATKRLQKLGVIVQTGARVEKESTEALTINGKNIPSHTVVWTSGVANNPFFANNSDVFQLAPNGRVLVDRHMQAHPHIYVIGDNAATQYGGLAQTALHDAVFVSKVLRARQQKRPIPSYRAVRPPVVIPAGDNWAVFEYGPIHFHGWPASIIRKMADLVGYSDVLPIGQALGVWRSEKVREETCPTCIAVMQTQ